MTKPKPASVAHSPTPSNEASQVIQMLNPTPAAGTTTTVSLSVATKTLDGEELVSEEVRQILYPDEEDTLTTDSDRERVRRIALLIGAFFKLPSFLGFDEHWTDLPCPPYRPQ